ncbi:MAG: c-type cytochrome, partial [Blastocatellia bacterium]
MAFIRIAPLLLFCLLLLLFFIAAAQPNRSPKPDELAQGKKLYNNQCALCHGIGGTGGRGPVLN